MTKEYQRLKTDENNGKWTFIQGSFLAFISGVLFTINNTIFKKYNLNQIDTILIRSLIQVLFLTFWIWYKKHQVWFGLTKLGFLVFFQGFADSLVLICIYQSLLYTSLGDAMTLIFSSPIFTSKFNTLRCLINVYKRGFKDA